MMLHENKDAFKALIASVSERTNIREDIIEKDYYLTLMFFELAAKQETLPAYFKGGTAGQRSGEKSFLDFKLFASWAVIKDCGKRLKKCREYTFLNAKI